MSDTEFRSPGLGEQVVIAPRPTPDRDADHTGAALEALNGVVASARAAREGLPVWPHDHTATCRNILTFFIGQLEHEIGKINRDVNGEG